MVITGLLFAIFCALPFVTHAANLSFSPQSGSYAVGSTLVVTIYVSSPDQAINAASGIISFPSDKLQVVSLSKEGSVFNLWVQEPLFSNAAGTVNFEGIVLNPGFIGQSGKIVSITFRVKAAGTAPVTFLSGSALANDGKGTNMLTDMGNASFQIGIERPEAPEIVTPSQSSDVPPAPEVSSLTHPDPNKWYAVKDAKFAWGLPKDITGSRLLIGRIPQAAPAVLYVPPIDSKKVDDITDGIFYFHIQLRNAHGWGGISHFRFQIDTEKPTRFDISEIERKELTDPRAAFVFDSRDKTSGIDHYEIQIDNSNPGVWRDDGTHKVETPVLGPGAHTLLARAVDKAGNSLVNSATFMIEALEPPTIADYPRELQSGEILTIRGKTKYPDARINVFLQHEKDEAKNYAVKSDRDGMFTFVAQDRLSSGIYTVWTEVADARGAKSNPSEKITISIGQAAFFRIGSWAVGFFAVVIPLVALVMALAAILWYGWHRFASFRKKVKKEVREAEGALHKAFDALRENVREQITMLEKTKTKRELTEEEEKIVKQLKKHLDNAEKFVRKEIEDIEKVAR